MNSEWKLALKGLSFLTNVIYLIMNYRDAPVPVMTGELGTSQTGYPVRLDEKCS